jgi:hypothetical protein
LGGRGPSPRVHGYAEKAIATLPTDGEFDANALIASAVPRPEVPDFSAFAARAR